MRIHPEKKKFLFSEREYSIVKTKIGLLFLLAVVVGQVVYGQEWDRHAEGTSDGGYIINENDRDYISFLRLQTQDNKGWVLFNNENLNWVYTTNSDVDQDVSNFSPLMTLQPSGNVGIGTNDPSSYKLAVNGKIRAKEIKVEAGWADYVFKEDYNLPTLEEVEQHIAEKGHLINIPSAKEVEEKGIYLGEMNKLLLEKIEELTLYTLQQQKELEKQQNEIELLKQQNTKQD